MTPPVRVGLIGHGTIACGVARHLNELALVNVELVGALARPGRCEAARASLGGAFPIMQSLPELLAASPTIVAECAGHGAVADYGADVLAAGVDLLVVSTGALADATLFNALQTTASQAGSRLVVAAGAVGAIDALAAARVAGLDRVVYRSRKPPAAWRGSPAETLCDLGTLSEPTTFFRGNAREAARDYPNNANVAATVALAGLGFEATQVELCADPGAAGNIHEVEAAGTAGHFRLELLGNTSPENPRTSQLTALSVLRVLVNLGSSIVI